MYRPKTAPKRKLLPRTVFGHFVGMESDVSLFRVFNPSAERIIIARFKDSHRIKYTELPNISSFMDGISRKLEIEALGRDLPRKSAIDEIAEEERLMSVLTAAAILEHSFFIYMKTLADPRLPRSFKQACEDPYWAAAIDKEFGALVNRGTWNLIPRTRDMHVVPYPWAFRLKPHPDGYYFHKASCSVRGDRQTPFMDFDPEITYAPVATHETLRVLIAFAAAQNLEIEGADISNAYLYGKMDKPIFMEQPTDSSQVPLKPCQVAKLPN